MPDPAHAVGHCCFGLASVATIGLDASSGSESAGGAERHPMPEGFREEVLMGCGVVELKVGAVGVEAWSPDSPWLYTVVVSLLDGAELVDVEVCRVGLRAIEIAEGCLLANGLPVEVRGVNRHEHDHLRGKHVTRECMVQDIKGIKMLNMNAVRTAHYPNCNLW